MALISLPPKPSPKLATGVPNLRSSVARRSYAASIKSIMHSRHAKTGRKTTNFKRNVMEEWVGEMVVVKVYDQRDSLRDVLESPARIHPLELDEQVVEEEVVEEEIPSTGVRIERIGKRKREDDDDNEEERGDGCDEKEIKRPRIAGATTRNVDCEDGEEADGGAKVKTVEVVMPSRATRSTGGENISSPAIDQSSTKETCSTALVRQSEAYYSWPALMARVDHQFGITTPPIDTPT